VKGKKGQFGSVFREMRMKKGMVRISDKGASFLPF